MATYTIKPATVIGMTADRKRATLAGLGPMSRMIVMPDASVLPDFVVEGATISCITATNGIPVAIEPTPSAVVVSVLVQP